MTASDLFPWYTPHGTRASKPKLVGQGFWYHEHVWPRRSRAGGPPLPIETRAEARRVAESLGKPWLPSIEGQRLLKRRRAEAKRAGRRGRHEMAARRYVKILRADGCTAVKLRSGPRMLIRFGSPAKAAVVCGPRCFIRVFKRVFT